MPTRHKKFSDSANSEHANTSVPAASRARYITSELASKILVRSKGFNYIRDEIPTQIRSNAMYCDDWVCLPKDEVVDHLKELQKQGLAQGLVPCTKEAYEMLQAAGLRGVSSCDRKWIVAVGGSVQHPKCKGISDLYFVGELKFTNFGPPLVTITMDEASLKSDFHAIRMVGKLLGRLKDILPSDLCAVRRGLRILDIRRIESGAKAAAATAKEAYPVEPKSEEEKKEKHADSDAGAAVAPKEAKPENAEGEDSKPPIPLETMKLLALLPGIAMIYDATRKPTETEAQEQLRLHREAQREARRLEGATEEEIAKEEAAEAEKEATAKNDDDSEDEETESNASKATKDSAAPKKVTSRAGPRGRQAEKKEAELLGAQMKRSRLARKGILGKVYCEGARGVPIDHTNKCLCLMSGGIDSPVAAYRMMTRGLHVDSVHYLNSTTDTADILTKLSLIQKRLSQIQGTTRLLLVDICALQNAIIAVAGISDRTLLYKLFMLLISAAIPDYLMLCTGDSVSQVASQTPRNVSVLYPLVHRALFSPLCGLSKTDIVKQARDIDLYEYSIMKGADCCQYLSTRSLANISISNKKLHKYVREVLEKVHTFKVTVMKFDNGQQYACKETFEVPLSDPHVVSPKPLNLDIEQNYLRRRTDRIARKAEATGKSVEEVAAEMQARGDEGTEARATVHNEEANLDSAAGTETHPNVWQAMLRAPTANPNALHTAGRDARAAVENARFAILQHMCPRSLQGMQCIFTSGGTESNNLAILGMVPLCRAVFAASTGHAAMTSPCESAAESNKVPFEMIPVDGQGLVNLEALEASLSEKHQQQDKSSTSSSTSTKEYSALVAVELVNNEIGVIQPVAEIAALCKRFNALFHVDACQAVGKLSCVERGFDEFSDFDASLFDSTAVSGHKCHGPNGIGASIFRTEVMKKMTILWKGGVQEQGIRPGTENVPGIIGFAEALKLPRSDTRGLWRRLRDGIAKLGLRINGCQDEAKNSAHIVHCTVQPELPVKHRFTSEADLIAALAAKHNVLASSGAACKSSDTSGEKLIYNALKLSPGPALRFSLDESTTEEHVDRAIEAVRAVLGLPQ